MSEIVHQLDDLIEPPISGFWGKSQKTSAAFLPGRVVRNGDVGKDGTIPSETLPVRWFTPKEIEKAKLKDGDSVLVSSGAYTGNIGRLHNYHGKHPVIISNFVRLLRPKLGVDGGWLFRLSRSRIIQSFVWANTGGSAIPNLGSSFYSSAKFNFFPTLEHQRLIAGILDTLDTQIQKTEALIAKLEKVKEGLLHDLLTRGIDENGQLRPSPEQAPELYKESPLGLIPREWNCKTLAETLSLQRGFDITVAEQTPGPYPVISSSGISSYHNDFKVRGPGVITGRKGKLGEVYFIKSDFWPHDTSLWVKKFHGNDAKFSALLLGRLKLERFDAATSVPTLNRNFVAHLPIAVPPKTEQQHIVKNLEVIDQRIAGETQLLKSNRKLKTGLMNDLLTGRVRVTPLLEQTQETTSA